MAPTGQVSIHAPVKGATAGQGNPLQGEQVSIHAPVKGATGHHHRCPRLIAGFNPRAREGRDAWVPEGGDSQEVSIHAPVKGATRTAGPDQGRAPVSIHAPVKGATRGESAHSASLEFQSTRP